MALIKNLYIDQGASFAATIMVTNAVLSTSLDMTNSRIYSHIKKSSYSTNISAEFHCTYLPDSKKLIIYLHDYETADLLPGRYEYDVMVVDYSRNSTTKIIGGIVHIDGTTTKVNG